MVGEVVARRRAGVHRHDAGVAGLVGPVLEVLVVGQRALLGRGDDLVGDVVGLGDDRPVALDRPADVLAVAAVLDLGQPLLRLVGVLDLDHDDRVGVLAAHVDGGDRGAVTEPRLDVVVVVEARALASSWIWSKISLRMSSSVSMPTSSSNAGNLLSVRSASIFWPPLGSRSMLT